LAIALNKPSNYSMIYIRSLAKTKLILSNCAVNSYMLFETWTHMSLGLRLYAFRCWKNGE